jgi:uncharacterized damage-inducible protein DinB
MQTEEIRLMFGYHYWADRRILDACQELTQEQYALDPDLGTGRGGLRDTLTHFVDTDRLWRLVCQGYHDTFLSYQDEETTQLALCQLPTLAALEKRWLEGKDAMMVYLAVLTDEKLNSVLRYTIPGGIVRERPLWQCLVHVVNHGTQHRSEAAVLLTSYGHSSGDLDYTLFLNEYYDLPLG